MFPRPLLRASRRGVGYFIYTKSISSGVVFPRTYNLPIFFHYNIIFLGFILCYKTETFCECFKHYFLHSKAVSEIKLLDCAFAGCTSHKTVHPEIAPCTLPIYSNNKCLKKRAYTGCTPPKIVHPAMEMCMPGAGCTLNFEHCKVSK